ncbi:MAG: WG repeat-containing protein [Clostridia bacterium]|nr:WG repeat-containing protein [Clostridia bacterium]
MKKLYNMLLILAIIGTICMRFAFAPQKSSNNLFVDGVVAAMLDWQPCIVNKSGEVVARLDPPDPDSPYPSSLGSFAPYGVALYSTEFYWLPSEFPAFKYGLVNTKGEFVLQPDFDYISDFQNGMAVVGKNGKYGIVNTIGEFVLEMCFDGLKAFENDRYAPAKSGEKWGYINKKGDFVIEPQFDDAHSFAGGKYARIEIDRLQGLIDRAGNIIVEPEFAPVGEIRDDMAIVTEIEQKRFGVKPHFSVLNIRTGELKWIDYDNVGNFAENGLARVYKFARWGFINTEGEEVIPLQFREARGFENGLAAVCTKDKTWGFINEKGEFELEIEGCIRLENFENGLAMARTENACGLINEKGEFVVKVENAIEMGHLHNGMAWFRDKNDKYGYVNADGEIVIEPQFERFVRNLKWGACNFYDDGYAIVETTDSKQGVIDKQGNFILEPIYDYIG